MDCYHERNIFCASLGHLFIPEAVVKGVEARGQMDNRSMHSMGVQIS